MTIDENTTPTGDQNVATAEVATDAALDITPEAIDSVAPDAPTEPEMATEPVVEEAATVEVAEATTPEVVAEVAPEPAAEPAPETPKAVEPVKSEPKSSLSDLDLFEAEMNRLESGEDNADYKRLSRGDRIEATVIQVDKDRVFVDLGTKSEGIVPLDELTHENIEHAGEHVKVGDKIKVVVLRPEGSEGNPIVSKKMADFEAAWDRIEQSFREGVMLTAQVVDRVKGGLVVDIGVRGFVPATHVGSGKLRNIEKYVGQQLDLKIIEIDRDRKKVVLSNREAEEKRRLAEREVLFTNVKPGDVLDGTVRRLTDYGAFIDLGGVDGLLHISEMSWMRISHPKEVLKEGQKIKVMVLRIDAGAGKVSLGHRQVLPDPWNLVREAYTMNQKLTVKISRLVPSGAFVKLPEGAEAFLPLSEMSSRRLRKPEEAVEEGQDVEVQIIDLRPEDRRMVLSIRAISGGGSGGGGMDYRSGGGGYGGGMGEDEFGRGAGKKGKKKGTGRRGRDDDDFEEVSGRRGFATGGATIGERLGMLKGFKIGEIDDDADEEEAPAGEAKDE